MVFNYKCSPILFDALAYGWHAAAWFRANLEFIAHVFRQVDGI
jgi:hypothetical protein